jgi:hypothetical protein
MGAIIMKVKINGDERAREKKIQEKGIKKNQYT